MSPDRYFRIPLDLPHAGTVAIRIQRELGRQSMIGPPDDGSRASDEAVDLARRLVDLLLPFRIEGENPPADNARQVVETAAELGRDLTAAIDAGALGEDRLGQCVRNLFECLEMGQEGARLGLKAGEREDSPQRP